MKSITRICGLSGQKRLWLAGICGAALSLSISAPASATPSYSFVQTIAIPGVTNFSGYDAAVFDPSTQLYYLTDRSNNGIDVFSGQTNTFVEQIGTGLFAGTQGGNNDISGPNGVAISDVSGGKLLVAGNGGSLSGPGVGTGNVITFNLATNGTTVIGSPRTVSTATATTPTPTNRADGVAYDPVANTILAANNASTPGYVTLISNATGTVTHTILLNGTNGTPNVGGQGVEGTVYDAANGKFYVAVPALSVDAAGNPADAGGVIEVDPNTGAILATYNLNSLGLSGTCSPTGLAQGAGSTFLVACSDPTAPGSFILNTAGTGSIQLVPGITGSDQAYYDPILNTYYESDRDAPGGPVLGIIDASTLSTQTLPIGANDHSVAVDPSNGEVFVATAGTTAFPGCTGGCIAVFAPVPEPGTLPVLAMALASLGVATRLRRR